MNKQRKSRGTVYARGGVLWIGWYDAQGKRHLDPTELRVGQEEDARKLLDTIHRRVEAEMRVGGTSGPLTVSRYAETRWIPDRRASGVRTVRDDETRLRLHALPRIGQLRLTEVRPHHIRDLIRMLKAGGKLAPRTIRHVYGLLHRLFEDARTDEIIETNPCVLKRGELPRKQDKDPAWRSSAIFTHAEVEQLIADERVPEDRRIFYAISFLTGGRTGEVSALRWRHYEPDLKPLGKLLVAASYSTKEKVEKGVKTGGSRDVPVHPTLADILAAWRRDGWQRFFGRPPTADDLIIPSREGRNRTNNHTLKKFYEDCERLGLRLRRQYDSRRTLISLALADGARKDILRWITHGPEGDILDVYTTLPWAPLCEEMVKLKISGQADQPNPANPRGDGGSELAPAATLLLQRAQVPEGIGEIEWRRRESNPMGTNSPTWRSTRFSALRVRFPIAFRPRGFTHQCPAVPRNPPRSWRQFGDALSCEGAQEPASSTAQPPSFGRPLPRRLNARP